MLQIGHNDTIVLLGQFGRNGIATFGGYLHLPLNPDRLQKLTENYVSSNEKIKKALGIDRMPVEARAGLQRTLESFR